MSYCDDCIHKPVCYRTDSVSPSYADKCGDFAFEKTGHWIFKKFDEESGISDSYWCSVCNHPMAQVYNNYCGYCGCTMIEPQESEG